MAIDLEQYRGVTLPGTVDLLYRLSDVARGKSFLHVNSTRQGGGVAEILHRLLPLLQELGIKTRWEVMEGDEEFFSVTKRMHNCIQGAEQAIPESLLKAYSACNRRNLARMDLRADLVCIHDPQPAALVEGRQGRDRWVWRCHIDCSHPQRHIWNFLRQFVIRYDATIFSLPRFAHSLPVPQFLVYPTIDPLSDKNRPLSKREVNKRLKSLGIPQDKPIVLQVSRFDRFKDPVGVILAFQKVRRHTDCRLVLAGGGAEDDPEGAQVLEEVKKAAGEDPDIHILVLHPSSHLDINALQRAATLVLQKSTREGFGLTVTEALWKGKPVIGGATGGIMVQVIPGVTGYLVNSVDGAAFYIRKLLNDPSLCRTLGENAREYVRSNFLITRVLGDYLVLMASLKQKSRKR
jgi:trehalose synthase